MSPRVLVCPDKFRGSLTAPEAAQAMVDGLARVGVREVASVALADGGEGTLDVLLGALGGQRQQVPTTDARGRPTLAEWGVLPDGTAIVEAATAAGLALVADDIDPIGATTAGLGQVIAAVLDQSPTRLIVTVGGTATTDGGLGALQELQWSLRGVDTIVACDVRTGFCDAARHFAPQKGASIAQVTELSDRLVALAARFAAAGTDVTRLPGSGSGGGLAGGLAAIGARLMPGFDVVADAVGLSERLTGIDAVLTGEGQLDASSLEGKVVGGVLDLASAAGLRCAVIVGRSEPRVRRQLDRRSVAVRVLTDVTGGEVQARAHARGLVADAAADWAATLGG